MIYTRRILQRKGRKDQRNERVRLTTRTWFTESIDQDLCVLIDIRELVIV